MTALDRPDEPHEYRPDEWGTRYGYDPNWCECGRPKRHALHVEATR